MLEDLRILRDIQNMDECLVTLDRDRAILRDSLTDIDRRLDEEKKALEERKAEQEEKQKVYRTLENDLKETEETILKYKRQEFDMKTNESLRALMKEIGTEQEKKSNLEDQALQTMEEIETLANSIREAERQLEQHREDARREKAGVQENMAKVGEQEAAAREERRKHEVLIPPALLHRYDKLRGHNHGIGVATIRNRTCSGCHRLITPQDVNLIKRNDRLKYCEGCGAILFWKDGGEEPGGTEG
ncbi:MAG: hypothetical protein KAW17_12060 [Candidatus Eisenbacteria sp.]|nr:hypothetical protein [Candidatus Eisenbacteria bacterium]